MANPFLNQDPRYLLPNEKAALVEQSPEAVNPFLERYRTASSPADLGTTPPSLESIQPVDFGGSTGFSKNFKKGVARGKDTLDATMYGLGAMASENLGLDGVNEWMLDGYEKNMAEAQKNRGVSFEQVTKDPYENFASWAAGALGEAVPSLASMAIGGGVVGGAAKYGVQKYVKNNLSKKVIKSVEDDLIKGGVPEVHAKRIVRQIAKKPESLNGTLAERAKNDFLRRQAGAETVAGATGNIAGAIGGGAGGYAVSSGQQAGGIYADLINEHGVSPEDADHVASIAGMAGGALDFLGVATALSRFFPKGGIAKSGTKELAKRLAGATLSQGTIEGGTEALQEIIAISAKAYADPEYNPLENEKQFEQAKWQVIEAGAAGAIVGKFTGLVGQSTQELTREQQEKEKTKKTPEGEAQESPGGINETGTGEASATGTANPDDVLAARAQAAADEFENTKEANFAQKMNEYYGSEVIETEQKAEQEPSINPQFYEEVSGLSDEQIDADIADLSGNITEAEDLEYLNALKKVKQERAETKSIDDSLSFNKTLKQFDGLRDEAGELLRTNSPDYQAKKIELDQKRQQAGIPTLSDVITSSNQASSQGVLKWLADNAVDPSIRKLSGILSGAVDKDAEISFLGQLLQDPNNEFTDNVREALVRIALNNNQDGNETLGFTAKQYQGSIATNNITDTDFKAIIATENESNPFFETTVAHEIIHQATLYATRRVKNGLTEGLSKQTVNAVNDLQTIFNDLQANAEQNKFSEYGMTNLDEFIATALTDVNMQKWLSQQQSVLGKKKSNLLKDILNTIKSLIGIDNNAFVDTYQSSLELLGGITQDRANAPRTQPKGSVSINESVAFNKKKTRKEKIAESKKQQYQAQLKSRGSFMEGVEKTPPKTKEQIEKEQTFQLEQKRIQESEKKKVTDSVYSYRKSQIQSVYKNEGADFQKTVKALVDQHGITERVATNYLWNERFKPLHLKEVPKGRLVHIEVDDNSKLGGKVITSTAMGLYNQILKSGSVLISTKVDRTPEFTEFMSRLGYEPDPKDKALYRFKKGKKLLNIKDPDEALMWLDAIELSKQKDLKDALNKENRAQMDEYGNSSATLYAIEMFHEITKKDSPVVDLYQPIDIPNVDPKAKDYPTIVKKVYDFEQEVNSLANEMTEKQAGKELRPIIQFIKDNQTATVKIKELAVLHMLANDPKKWAALARITTVDGTLQSIPVITFNNSKLPKALVHSLVFNLGRAHDLADVAKSHTATKDNPKYANIYVLQNPATRKIANILRSAATAKTSIDLKTKALMNYLKPSKYDDIDTQTFKQMVKANIANVVSAKNPDIDEKIYIDLPAVIKQFLRDGGDISHIVDLTESFDRSHANEFISASSLAKQMAEDGANINVGFSFQKPPVQTNIKEVKAVGLTLQQAVEMVEANNKDNVVLTIESQPSGIKSNFGTFDLFNVISYEYADSKLENAGFLINKESLLQELIAQNNKLMHLKDVKSANKVLRLNIPLKGENKVLSVPTKYFINNLGKIPDDSTIDPDIPSFIEQANAYKHIPEAIGQLVQFDLLDVKDISKITWGNPEFNKQSLADKGVTEEHTFGNLFINGKLNDNLPLHTKGDGYRLLGGTNESPQYQVFAKALSTVKNIQKTLDKVSGNLLSKKINNFIALFDEAMLYHPNGMLEPEKLKAIYPDKDSGIYSENKLALHNHRKKQLQKVYDLVEKRLNDSEKYFSAIKTFDLKDINQTLDDATLRNLFFAHLKTELDTHIEETNVLYGQIVKSINDTHKNRKATTAQLRVKAENLKAMIEGSYGKNEVPASLAKLLQDQKVPAHVLEAELAKQNIKFEDKTPEAKLQSVLYVAGRAVRNLEQQLYSAFNYSIEHKGTFLDQQTSAYDTEHFGIRVVGGKIKRFIVTSDGDIKYGKNVEPPKVQKVKNDDIFQEENLDKDFANRPEFSQVEILKKDSETAVINKVNRFVDRFITYYKNKKSKLTKDEQANLAIFEKIKANPLASYSIYKTGVLKGKLIQEGLKKEPAAMLAVLQRHLRIDQETSDPLMYGYGMEKLRQAGIDLFEFDTLVDRMIRDKQAVDSEIKKPNIRGGAKAVEIVGTMLEAFNIKNLRVDIIDPKNIKAYLDDKIKSLNDYYDLDGINEKIQENLGNPSLKKYYTEMYNQAKSRLTTDKQDLEAVVTVAKNSKTTEVLNLKHEFTNTQYGEIKIPIIVAKPAAKPLEIQKQVAKIIIDQKVSQLPESVLNKLNAMFTKNGIDTNERQHSMYVEAILKHYQGEKKQPENLLQLLKEFSKDKSFKTPNPRPFTQKERNLLTKAKAKLPKKIRDEINTYVNSKKGLTDREKQIVRLNRMLDYYSSVETENGEKLHKGGTKFANLLARDLEFEKQQEQQIGNLLESVSKAHNAYQSPQSELLGFVEDVLAKTDYQFVDNRYIDPMFNAQVGESLSKTTTARYTVQDISKDIEDAAFVQDEANLENQLAELAEQTLQAKEQQLSDLVDTKLETDQVVKNFTGIDDIQSFNKVSDAVKSAMSYAGNSKLNKKLNKNKYYRQLGKIGDGLATALSIMFKPSDSRLANIRAKNGDVIRHTYLTDAEHADPKNIDFAKYKNPKNLGAAHWLTSKFSTFPGEVNDPTYIELTKMYHGIIGIFRKKLVGNMTENKLDNIAKMWAQYDNYNKQFPNKNAKGPKEIQEFRAFISKLHAFAAKKTGGANSSFLQLGDSLPFMLNKDWLANNEQKAREIMGDDTYEAYLHGTNFTWAADEQGTRHDDSIRYKLNMADSTFALEPDMIKRLTEEGGREMRMNIILDRYLHAVAERISFDETFGEFAPDPSKRGAYTWQPAYHLDKTLTLLKDKASHFDYNQAISIIEGYRGRKQGRLSPNLRRASATAITYQNVINLLLALPSSIPDIGTMYFSAAHYKGGFGAVTKHLKDGAKFWINDIVGKEDKNKDIEDLAKLIGVIEYDVTHHVLDTMKEVSADTKLNNLNNWFFRKIGLELWTRTTKVMAMKTGISMMKAHARNGDKDRFLKSLNITADQVNSVDFDNMTETAGNFNEAEQAVALGLQRFVHQSVMHPEAYQRPDWGNDLRYKVFFQLKSFVYSMHSTVTRRAMHDFISKNGLQSVAPLLMTFPIYFALAALGTEIKNILKYDIPGLDIRRPKHARLDDGALMLEYMQRTGLYGLGQFAIDMDKAAERGGSGIASIGGPSVSHLDQLLTIWANDRDYDNLNVTLQQLPVFRQLTGLRHTLVDL